MQVTNIYQAKTHFSQLVAQAAQGDDVIIAKAGKPVAKLVAYDNLCNQRRPGIWKNKITMDETFIQEDATIETLFYDKEN